MSKRPSVIKQALDVLKFAESFGTKRHGDKKNAKNKGLKYDAYSKSKIYSDKTFRNTKNTVMQYVRFCKAEHGIRYLEEIKPQYFAQFIVRGKVGGRSYEKDTAGTYATHIRKLQNAFNKMHNTDCKFADDSYKEYAAAPVQVRTQMPPEMHTKIIERAYQTSSNNGRAFEIARNLGLRASEISNLRMKDFIFNKDGSLAYVHIHRSKGGRNRDLVAGNLDQGLKAQWHLQSKGLDKEQYAKVREIYNYYANKEFGGEDKLFPNKPESYERAFARSRNWVEDRNMGHEKMEPEREYTHCGIHSMRKEFAKNYFNREVEMGRDPEEVKKELTTVLGHNRIEVLDKHYLN